MGSTDILIVGAGGHAKVVIETARAAGYTPVGVVAEKLSVEAVAGVPVIGTDDDVPRLLTQGYEAAFVAIGDNATRLRVGRWLLGAGFRAPVLVHPAATLSGSARIGQGTLVMPSAVVNADARIGDFAIVNTAAVVEHDCTVGDGAHLGPGSVLAGAAWVEDGVLLGAGVVIRPCTGVGARSVVGAGAVVVHPIPPGVVAMGIPATPRSKEQQ